MRRRARSILAVGALLFGGASLAPVAQAHNGSSPGTDPNEVKVFRADVTAKQVPLLPAAGQDGHELGETVPDKGKAAVEVYLTDQQARSLREQGVALTEHTLSARTEKRVGAAAEGVFRPYSGSGGLKEEIVRTRQANPGLTKVVSLGKTVNGQDILAVKLTKGARKSKDGSKPSVLYMSNQHAREWITPEMTRRLMHHYLDNHKTDKHIRKIVDSTELWFVISANPDGYDCTFQNSDTRLWRKNLRDVNGDGVISTGDGVDLNRNFAYKWGYDDEGSSPNSTSETYRGAAFALSVAETAAHPDTPSSSLGLTAADFTPAGFATSYSRGADQEVSVVARKSVRDKELRYRVNGGRTRDRSLKAWKGGETYGGEDNLHFDEYRAKVKDGDPGDKVEVWFTGRSRSGKKVSSEHFTYTVAQRAKADTLVVADEGAAATQAQTYVDALRAAGRKAIVWDVATQGAPDALGVLKHFRTVVHYTGASVPGNATQLQLRAHLNEGGKLIEAGEQAGGNVDLGGGTLSDDFSQYYLGAYSRTSTPGATGFTGSGRLDGSGGALGAAPGNPLDKAGTYGVTSAELAADKYPQFASAGAGQFAGTVNPYGPYAGSSMAAAVHTDDAYKRLTHTIDLSGVTTADKPTLRAQLLWDTEPGYDNAVVEAHTVGADDWTTLPEAGGATRATVPAECGAGFYIGEHPWLKHYLTLSGDGCTATGTSGSWNALTGASNGWQQVNFDLSAYVGKSVEISISYVTDPGTGGHGVLAADASLVVGGTATGGGPQRAPQEGARGPRRVKPLVNDD